MRFRRAFIALAACLTPPAVAAAQDARQVDIAYEITFAGISGLPHRRHRPLQRLELRRRDQHLQGRRAEGRHHELRRPQPRLGRLHDPGRATDARDRCRSASTASRAPGWRSTAPRASCRRPTIPVWKPTPQQTISDADRKDSLDPLSAALSVGFAGDAACDKTVRSQRRQAAHRRAVPQDRHGARGGHGHPGAQSATCWSARSTPSASPASSTRRPRKPRPNASGRSRSGWRASTTRRSAIPASSRRRPCSPPSAAGSCRSASGR